jgi:hypothetical protein
MQQRCLRAVRRAAFHRIFSSCRKQAQHPEFQIGCRRPMFEASPQGLRIWTRNLGVTKTDGVLPHRHPNRCS